MIRRMGPVRGPRFGAGRPVGGRRSVGGLRGGGHVGPLGESREGAAGRGCSGDGTGRRAWPGSRPDGEAKRCQSRKGESLDGEVESPVAAQELRAPSWHAGRLGAEGGGELALEPQPRMLLQHRGEDVRGQLPRAHADHVHARTGRQQVGHGAVCRRDAGAVVQRDRGADRLGGGGGQAHLLGDVPGDAGAAPGEVDVPLAGRQAGVVQQGGGEEQLGIDCQALQRAQGGTEGEGAVGVVQQCRTEPALCLRDGGPGERRTGRDQLGGVDLCPQTGVQPGQHRQTTDGVDRVRPCQGWQQRAALGTGQLSTGAIDPAVRSEVRDRVHGHLLMFCDRGPPPARVRTVGPGDVQILSRTCRGPCGVASSVDCGG